MKFLTNLILVLVTIALCCVATLAHSAGVVDHLYVGVNGAWLDGPSAAWPADVEVGGAGSASLSPHISLKAEAFYGFSHSYVRWDAGPCVTVTDVDNPNLSVGLGIGYRGGSTRDVGPDEWAPYTSVGWRPNPLKWPNILLGGRAGLGLTSNRTLLTLGVRYSIPLK